MASSFVLTFGDDFYGRSKPQLLSNIKIWTLARIKGVPSIVGRAWQSLLGSQKGLPIRFKTMVGKFTIPITPKSLNLAADSAFQSIAEYKRGARSPY